MKKEEINPDNSFGTSSVVIGIISMVFSGVVPIAGFVLSILAIIFSIKQKNRHKNNWSKAGFILGLLGAIISTAVFLITIYILKNPEILSQYGVK